MSSGCDRLSSLPDDLIHKILSFIGIEHAIRTSILSSRWRYIWTSMPYLDFLTLHYFRLCNPPENITHVLSARDNQTEVSSMKLCFHREVSQAFVKRILNYALSHNIKQLKIYCSIAGHGREPPSFSFFSSQSLKNLALAGWSYYHSIAVPPTWELPALTTLSLYEVRLHDHNTGHGGLFSKYPNLKNLTLMRCQLTGLDSFNICHPGLSSLTLECCLKGVNVVTPQLNNLTITRWRGIHLLSAPNLSTLFLQDDYYFLSVYKDLLQLPINLLHLEKVDLCLKGAINDVTKRHKIVRLLKQLHSVKYLSLNMEFVKFLSKCLTNPTSTFSVYQLKECKDNLP